jgi:hypothetical protein
MIQERLTTIQELEGKFRLLPQQEASSSIEYLLKMLTPDFMSSHKIMEEDFSSSDPSNIYQWLVNLGINDTQLYVYWVTNIEGIEIALKDFMQFYDELWYPGADDILVTNQSKQWILNLHHEEVFTFFRN